MVKYGCGRELKKKSLFVQSVVKQVVSTPCPQISRESDFFFNLFTEDRCFHRLCPKTESCAYFIEVGHMVGHGIRRMMKRVNFL